MLTLLYYSTLSLFVLFFCLPTCLNFRAARTRPGGPLSAELDCSFFTGLAGLRLRALGSTRFILPLIGGQSLEHLRVSLRPGKGPIPSKGGRSARGKKSLQKEPAGGAMEKEGSLDEAVDSAADEKTEFHPEVADPEPKIPTGDLQRKLRILRVAAGPAVTFLRRVPQAISVPGVGIDASVGMANPASTGLLAGLGKALCCLDNRRFRLALQTDFCQSGITGTVSLRLRIHLGLLILFALLLVAHVGMRWLILRFSSLSFGRSGLT